MVGPGPASVVPVRDADDLVHRLGELVLADPGVVVDPEWAYVVLAGTVDETACALTGFCYPASGEPESATPCDDEVLVMLGRLRAAMAERDGRSPWTACLVRITRAGLGIAVEFEHDDPDRWRVTGRNRARRAVELDPRDTPGDGLRRHDRPGPSG